MINAQDTIKIQPLYKRIFCIHSFTGGARVICDNKGVKRHGRICVKCGKREYDD